MMCGCLASTECEDAGITPNADSGMLRQTFLWTGTTVSWACWSGRFHACGLGHSDQDASGWHLLSKAVGLPQVASAQESLTALGKVADGPGNQYLWDEHREMLSKGRD